MLLHPTVHNNVAYYIP